MTETKCPLQHLLCIPDCAFLVDTGPGEEPRCAVPLLAESLVAFLDMLRSNMADLAEAIKERGGTNG